METPSDGETVLGTEVDVDQGEIRAQLTSDSDRLFTAGRDGQDVDPFLLQNLTRGQRESRVVIDDQAAYRHESERYERESAIGFGLATVFTACAARRTPATIDNPHMTADMPGVLIAEDDVLLREGLARLLADEGFRVIDQAGNASALLALAHRHRPDLVILDIRMPPTHTTEGLDAARTIRAEMPETAVVVLSAHAEVEQATDLLACGERSGYLLKSRVTDVDEFIATLRRIIGGAAVVDPLLIQQLVAARRAEDPLEDLSAREREVLALMAEGRSNAGIAKQLWVTESTVEKHVHSIFMKLRLPETGDDHRRVLAVIRFLHTR